MQEQKQFMDELLGDCPKISTCCIPFEEYLLLCFLTGNNVELDKIALSERKHLSDLSEKMLIFTPVTNLKISREYYQQLIDGYKGKPILYAALCATQSNPNLPFF